MCLASMRSNSHLRPVTKECKGQQVSSLRQPIKFRYEQVPVSHAAFSCCCYCIMPKLKPVQHPGQTPPLTHTNSTGQAAMVDIGSKAETRRAARAVGRVQLGMAAYEAVRNNLIQKGNVLAVAKLAGIMAAKKTSDLIPLCHSLALDRCCTLMIDSQLFCMLFCATLLQHILSLSPVQMTSFAVCRIALLVKVGVMQNTCGLPVARGTAFSPSNS